MARVDEVLAVLIGGAGEAANTIVETKLAMRDAKSQQEMAILDKYLSNKQLEYNKLATETRDRIGGRTAQTAKDKLDFDKGEADRSQKALDTRITGIDKRIDRWNKQIEAERGKDSPNSDLISDLESRIDAAEGFQDALAAGDTKASYKDYLPKERTGEGMPARVVQAQAARDAILAQIPADASDADRTKLEKQAYDAYLEILGVGSGVGSDSKLTPAQIETLMSDINASDEYSAAQKAAIQLELETTGKVSSTSLKPWHTSKPPDLGDEIAKFAETSGLVPDEVVKLAEYLKPKLGTFSSRSKFTQIVIKNAIKGVLAMGPAKEGLNRVDAWVDRQFEMNNAPNIKRFRPVYNYIEREAARRSKEYQEAVSFQFGMFADAIENAKTPEERLAAESAMAEAMLLFGEHNMNVNASSQRRMGGSRLLLAAGIRLQDALERLTKLGVDTGAIDPADLGRKDGIYEKLVQSIAGGTSNPNYIEIENLSQLYQAAYTLMVSGTAASDKEVARIAQQFIDITKNEGLNKARIDSLVKNSYSMLQDSYGSVYGSGLKRVFSGEAGRQAVKNAVQAVSTGTTWKSVEEGERQEESIEDRKQRIGREGGAAAETETAAPDIDPLISKWATHIMENDGTIERLREQLAEAGHDAVQIDAWIAQVEKEVARLSQ